MLSTDTVIFAENFKQGSADKNLDPKNIMWKFCGSIMGLLII
jgi:hypothetical protein